MSFGDYIFPVKNKWICNPNR